MSATVQCRIIADKNVYSQGEFSRPERPITVLCNFLQFQSAIFSVLGLQLSVILLCNKQLVVFFLVRCASAPASLVLFIILAVASSRSALRHRHRIWGSIIPYDMYVLLTVLVVEAICVRSIAYVFIRMDKDYAEAAAPVTEGNGILALFWELTPYTTEDDVMGWIRGYDLGVIRSDGTYNDAYAKGDIKHTREFSIAASSESAWFSKGYNGAYSTLTYAEEGSSYLLTAQMIVNTDNGTATCYYYPTEYTENGCDPGDSP